MDIYTLVSSIRTAIYKSISFDTMLTHFIYCTISILILSYIIIKLRYRFWSSQPVFHTYNLLYWLFPPGIIHHDLPRKTKFYDSLIECSAFTNLDAKKKALLYYFIRMHYTYLKDIQFIPTKEKILSLLTNNSYISLQYSFLPKKIIACMVTRPLECTIRGQTLHLSYMDFLCVRREYRRKGYAAKQLYTHYYKSRELGENPVFLFKKIGDNTILTPLTIYNTYLISTRQWSAANLQLPNNISTHIIKLYNLELLLHFMNEFRMNFDCIIAPKKTQLASLVENGYLIPTIMMDGQLVVGAIFFRNAGLSWHGENLLECIGSYCSRGYENIFKQSLSNSILLLKKDHKFSVILIENISHNYLLIKRVLERSIPKWICPQGYYFYNFAYTPFFSPNVFIIN